VLLAQDPEAEQRVHAEVDALPDPSGGGWGAEVLEQLPFTRAVIDECLRLYPPAWVITRRSLEPDSLGGFDLPVGATVILSPYAMHRAPRWWPDPERFDPERFLGSSIPAESGRGPLTYFPFGAGPRLCIGRDLALMEAPMVIATLARVLRVRPQRPASVLEDFGVTLRPKGGLPVQVARRGRR
jgi:cytochrome P450